MMPSCGDEGSALSLGSFLFQDPTTTYTVESTLDALPPLPDRTGVEAAAKQNNPDLRAALESVKASKLELREEWFGYVPNLGLQYIYGIDARSLRRRRIRPTAAVALPYTRNLGLLRPLRRWIFRIWDWFSNHEKIKQGRIHDTGTDGVDDYAAAIDCLANELLYRS